MDSVSAPLTPVYCHGPKAVSEEAGSSSLAAAHIAGIRAAAGIVAVLRAAQRSVVCANVCIEHISAQHRMSSFSHQAPFPLLAGHSREL